MLDDQKALSSSLLWFMRNFLRHLEVEKKLKNIKGEIKYCSIIQACA
jgi:hypothetical protein